MRCYLHIPPPPSSFSPTITFFTRHSKASSLFRISGAMVEGEDDTEKQLCIICLSDLQDKTVLPQCLHLFCFECILRWTELKRKVRAPSDNLQPNGRTIRSRVS